MAAQTHEQTINTALGEVIHRLGEGWTVRSEQVGGIFEDGGRPDVLVEKPGGWPIVVEAEVGNRRQAELEARSRLGKRVLSSGRTVDCAIALVYPAELRNYSGKALREAIREARLDYTLVTTAADGTVKRLPAAGWLSGSVTEVALLLHRSSTPA